MANPKKDKLPKVLVQDPAHLRAMYDMLREEWFTLLDIVREQAQEIGRLKAECDRLVSANVARWEQKILDSPVKPLITNHTFEGLEGGVCTSDLFERPCGGAYDIHTHKPSPVQGDE